jgi:hypothetical protein
MRKRAAPDSVRTLSQNDTQAAQSGMTPPDAETIPQG